MQVVVVALFGVTLRAAVPLAELAVAGMAGRILLQPLGVLALLTQEAAAVVALVVVLVHLAQAAAALSSSSI